MRTCPTFYVDITRQFDKKMEVVKCYHSQFIAVEEYAKINPHVGQVFDRIECYNRYMGQAARVKYAEAFVCREPILIDDIAELPVNTF